MADTSASADILDQLIDEAEELPITYELAKAGPERLASDDYPMVTLHKLEMNARVHFRAGLRLLRDPTLAYAAAANIRVLIEYMAHVLWICGKDGSSPHGGMHRRAVCLEMGTIRQLQGQIKGLSEDWGGTDDAKSQVAAAHDKLADLHRAGCKKTCSGRTQRNVAASLKSLSKCDNDFYMYEHYYHTGSMALHHQLIDAMIGWIDANTRKWMPASHSDRARDFVILVDTYSHGLRETLEVDSSCKVDLLSNAVRGLLTSERLKTVFTH